MSTPTSIDNVPEFAKIIINAFVSSTRYSVNMLIIGTLYSAILIPLLICLFAFSSARTRRTPMFMLITFDIILGLVNGVGNGYLEAHVLTDPFNIKDFTQKVFGFGVIFVFTPWIIDLALLLRLAAVYPPNKQQKLATVSIFAFPVLVKIARLVMIILYTRIFWNDLSGNGISSTLVSAVTAPYTKAEWFLQIFDNAYLSGMFLFKLRSSLGTSLAVTTKSSTSITNRIRTLFWIASTNFVFPVAFNIAQVVVMYRSSSAITASYLMWTNIYVSIVGVVYATVWSHATNPETKVMHDTAPYESPRYRGSVSLPIAFARPVATVTTTTTSVAAPPGLPEFDIEYPSREQSEDSGSWMQGQPHEAATSVLEGLVEEKARMKAEV